MVRAIALALQPNARRPLMSRAALALIVACALALLALLVVAAVLAGPHLVAAAHSLAHSALASVGASPMGCGGVPGSCD